MENAPIIKGFEKVFDIYKSIVDQKDRDLFFRFFYLYVNGGVYFDNAGMIDTNIDEIVSDYSFCYVDAKYMEKNILNQFIACEKENPIIKEIFMAIYSIDKIFLSSNPSWMEIKIYEIIEKNSNKIEKMKKYTEKIIDDLKTEIYGENGKLFFSFYFADSVVKSKNIIKKRKPASIRETKIGLTFMMPKVIGDMYSDGIKQNVLYLYELLKNIGYDAYIVIAYSPTKGCKLNETDIKNLFYYVCNKLTDEGIMEMYFDKGEFCWRPSQKFLKDQLSKEVEVEMEKSAKRKKSKKDKK
jgi:hypothetical protein